MIYESVETRDKKDTLEMAKKVYEEPNIMIRQATKVKMIGYAIDRHWMIYPQSVTIDKIQRLDKSVIPKSFTDDTAKKLYDAIRVDSEANQVDWAFEHLVTTLKLDLLQSQSKKTETDEYDETGKKIAKSQFVKTLIAHAEATIWHGYKDSCIRRNVSDTKIAQRVYRLIMSDIQAMPSFHIPAFRDQALQILNFVVANKEYEDVFLELKSVLLQAKDEILPKASFDIQLMRKKYIEVMAPLVAIGIFAEQDFVYNDGKDSNISHDVFYAWWLLTMSPDRIYALTVTNEKAMEIPDTHTIALQRKIYRDQNMKVNEAKRPRQFDPPRNQPPRNPRFQLQQSWFNGCYNCGSTLHFANACHATPQERQAWIAKHPRGYPENPPVIPPRQQLQQLQNRNAIANQRSFHMYQ